MMEESRRGVFKRRGETYLYCLKARKGDKGV